MSMLYVLSIYRQEVYTLLLHCLIVKRLFTVYSLSGSIHSQKRNYSELIDTFCMKAEQYPFERKSVSHIKQ